MRPALLLLVALALIAMTAPAQGQAQPPDVLAPEEEGARIERAALESSEAPVPPTLAGANGALLFGALGAAFGAVVALGRYHKKHRPIDLGVLRGPKP